MRLYCSYCSIIALKTDFPQKCEHGSTGVEVINGLKESQRNATHPITIHNHCKLLQSRSSLTAGGLKTYPSGIT